MQETASPGLHLCCGVCDRGSGFLSQCLHAGPIAAMLGRGGRLFVTPSPLGIRGQRLPWLPPPGMPLLVITPLKKISFQELRTAFRHIIYLHFLPTHTRSSTSTIQYW